MIASPGPITPFAWLLMQQDREDDLGALAREVAALVPSGRAPMTAPDFRAFAAMYAEPISPALVEQMDDEYVRREDNR